MKKIGIMQPYFLPYIGYFQLIAMVDEFVIYDNIEFSKASWIRRNRMLQNGKGVYFTLPVKKDSDFLDVDQRYLIDDFKQKGDKLLRKIEANYKKAPHFETFFPIVEKIISYRDFNLFNYILYSVETIKEYLEIQTPIKVFSKIGKEINQLKAQDKVIGVCKALHATHYINSAGGKELYNAEDFAKEQIKLIFYKTEAITYSQFGEEFVPLLSILDVCMFNSREQIKTFLKEYKIISPTMKAYSFNKSNVQQIQEHLWRVDQDFKPALHTYVDIDAYAQKIADSAVRLEFFVEDKLIGLMASYYNPEKQFLFITNFSIESKYRGHGMDLIIGLLHYLGNQNSTVSPEIEVVAKDFSKVLFDDLKGAKIPISSVRTEVRNANQKLIAFYKKLGFFELKKELQSTYLIKQI
ncbi:WbqC family protein [Aequorivita marina]|uniref:WbqC family protein n=1 Tax=Aequorivita marina TaxID=3073654 RepID=UPI002875133B|nr:WbqC family protein [Aequorivita sp. S2608]MDS1299060.1 WbqC family protein [Aequorivita sp. S2608]